MEDETAYKKQVLKTFFKNGMLLKIPVQKRKKDVVFEKIASRLEINKEYTEAQFIEFLRKIFSDADIIKKHLMDSRFVKVSKGLISRAGS